MLRLRAKLTVGVTLACVIMRACATAAPFTASTSTSTSTSPSSSSPSSSSPSSSSSSSSSPNCTLVGEALCSKDGACAAFGVYGDEIQLHGCNATVANSDWTIFVAGPGQGQYTRLPGTINIDETQCSTHPNSGMSHSCSGPPPPPAPPLYTRVGAIDVGTYENTIVASPFDASLLTLENIACSYREHAGIWEPEVYGNHSYARLRDLATGVVLVNLTSTVGYGFLSAFADYDRNVLWLFGTKADRCSGNGDATEVWAWWTTDPTLQAFQGPVLAFDLGSHTYNVEVAKVGPLGGASDEDRTRWEELRALRASSSSSVAPLPPHSYVMVMECFSFAVNNDPDGNLTRGWELLSGTAGPQGGSCGGPALTYSPLDDFYYFLTGGDVVRLFRTQDFVSWSESTPSPFIFPGADDSLISPFQDFAHRSTYLGSPPNKYVGVPEPYPSLPFNPWWMGATNYTAWDKNSNDGDVCCMHKGVPNAYVVWGASTQGGPPSPPLDGTDASTNSVGVATNMTLVGLLAAYFVNATVGGGA
jgi:hypothetical protein